MPEKQNVLCFKGIVVYLDCHGVIFQIFLLVKQALTMGGVKG